MQHNVSIKRFPSITKAIVLCVCLFWVPLSGAASAPSTAILPLGELQAFGDVYYYIKSTYVTEVNDKDLINAAIRGMVSNLDDHSKYFDPAEFANFNADNNGEYAGIGLSFFKHQDGLMVETVIENSPAERKGLDVNMLITKINGIDTRQISLKDAYKLLHGKPNTSVNLSAISIEMKNTAKRIEQSYVLNREIIYLPSVISNLLPNAIGHMAISQFTRNSTQEVIKAIKALSKEVPLKKLIIDLRDNPGGSLEAAIEISDLFVSEGTLLTSSGRTPESSEVISASGLAPYNHLDILIMINAYSASSSEILTAALQDNDTARVIGTTSYGKGSIQSIIALRNDSGLKITTAEYYSPKGHKIQDEGIQPDILFNTKELNNTENIDSLNDLQLLQAYLLLKRSGDK